MMMKKSPYQAVSDRSAKRHGKPYRFIAGLCRTARNFVSDTSGNVWIIFAFSMIPLFLAVGIGVDIGRAYSVKARLNYALDAAGLAVGSSQDLTNAQLEQLMLDYFSANFDAANVGAGVVGSPTMVIDDKEIFMTASATVPMVFMRVTGFNEITVVAESTILKETSGFEVALILDNTGSMNSQNKIGKLRDAATDFIDVIYKTEETVPFVWISVVPYAASVNAGFHPEWLDPGDPYFDVPTAFDPGTWKGCMMARGEPYDQDDTPPSAQPFTSYLWPSAGNNSWPSIYETSSSTSRGPNKFCPDPILPLTAEKTPILAAIAGMEPWMGGGTTGSLGSVWGWRTLSPQWQGLWGGTTPSTHPLPYDEPRMEKVAIIMTDGQNQLVSASCSYGCSHFSGYGTVEDFGFPNVNAARVEIDARQAAICENMKAVGIIIFTITFGNPDSTARNLYRDCATTPDHYFDAPDSAALEDAFKSIGTELSNLRITN